MDEHDSLFPVLPEDLAALSDEELNDLLAQSVEAKDRIVAKDAEFLADRTGDQILDEMKAGVDGILRLKAEQASRDEAAENFDATVEALAAKVGEPETLDTADEIEQEADLEVEDEPKAELEAEAETVAAEAEPVVASAEKPRVLYRMPAAGRHSAITAGDRSGMTLVASAGLSGFKPGEAIDTEEKLAYAIRAAAQTEVNSPPGFSMKTVVARGDLKDDPSFPEFRRIHNEAEESTKIKQLVAAAAEYGITDDPDSLTASGGICAPVTPYYQLANVSTVQRPVRDSLVGFIADRGGIRFMPPPKLSAITTAVGAITAANDKLGGTFGTKSCQTVICPSQVEVDVTSIFHCVEAGNLGARAFPEQIAQFNALVLAAHARLAESLLLDAIKAGSTNVTADGQATANDGAIATLLNDILVSAAGMRSRNRMMQDSRLQAILPAWTSDMLVADLVASQFQRFAYNQAGVEALLETFGINVAWTLDGPSTGIGQVFGTQSAGAVDPFPADIQWALFPAGSWLFVDSGVLELGIVRDSVLNATNSYQIFGESWENAAGIGVESLWITSTACANGVVSVPASPVGC